MTDLGVVIECDCEEWRLFAEEIFIAQIELTRITGYLYSGTLWAFCPWCGRKLRPTRPTDQAGVAPHVCPDCGRESEPDGYTDHAPYCRNAA